MRRWPIALLLLGLCVAPLAAQFYSSLSPDQRKTLAEDYYLAGSQYLAAGLEKGRDLQALARAMDPGLDPRAIRDTEQPTAAEILARGGVVVAGPPGGDTTAAIIRSRLLRLIGAILTEDADAVAQGLDGSLYLTDHAQGTELSRESARDQMEGLFDATTLAGVTPSRLYRLDTLVVSAATPDLAARGFADAYTADIDTAMELPGLAIWRPHQRFYFRQSGGSWLIFAFGSTLPPVGWKPAALTHIEPPAAGAAAMGAQERATIEAAFLSCVARFLQKDRDGALRYFAPRVRLERMDATVERSQLGAAFQSYFGSMDFGGLKTEDLVEPQSIFVAETERFAELGGGKRYMLTVQTSLDLAERIPFWTRFQEYYFALVDGAWRIYAIF